MKAHARKGSGGPRSAAGKAIASRNALRHGFAATYHPRSHTPERVEGLARAIAGDDSDPAIVVQAFKIAENELLLAEIAMHKVWVVERLRERYAVPFAEKDNSLQLEKARFMAGWLAEWAMKTRLPGIIAKYEMELYTLALLLHHVSGKGDDDKLLAKFRTNFTALAKRCAQRQAAPANDDVRQSVFFRKHDGMLPSGLFLFIREPKEEDASAKNSPTDKTWKGDWDDRNDYEALEAAVQDLIRLDRYEQRAWSRQKRAILQLADIKLQRRLLISLKTC